MQLLRTSMNFSLKWDVQHSKVNLDHKQEEMDGESYDSFCLHSLMDGQWH